MDEIVVACINVENANRSVMIKNIKRLLLEQFRQSPSHSRVQGSNELGSPTSRCPKPHGPRKSKTKIATRTELTGLELFRCTCVHDKALYYELLKLSQIPLRYLVRTSFEPASNQLRTRQRNGIWWRTC